MRFPPVLAILLLVATPSLAAPPPLAALAGWRAGQWSVGEVGGHPSGPRCVAGPEAMLLAGRPNAGCQFSVIEDGASSAVVTYRCADGRQGRTGVRRDTGDLFTVDAQGVEGGRPFASRTEWRRMGRC